MASQSAIADSNNGVVSSDCISYRQNLFSHPNYKYVPVYPNTFGAAINLGAASLPSITMNLPVDVLNFSPSVLNFTLNLPAAGAGNYIWYHLQPMYGSVMHAQVYAGSNQYMLDIDNLPNYLDISVKRNLEADEFLSLDPMTGTSQSNSVVNVTPALRNANYNGNNTLTTGFAANPSSINYTEPGYFGVGGANADVTLYVQFPLHLIRDSLFSINKSLYFGQVIYLKLYFSPLSKICYVSTSNANPSAAAKSTYTGAATITNLNLMLATENNMDLRNQLIEKVSTVGLSYNIPYIQSWKNNNSGQAQNITLQMDVNNGKSLQKMIHSVYNPQENLDTAYDHSNNDTISGVTSTAVNCKVQQYYTQMNSKRIQDITIDCTSSGPYLDYMVTRNSLRKTILKNQNIFAYNWHHIDDFCNFEIDYNQSGSSELLAGVPLTSAPITWAFVGTVMRNPGVALSDNQTFQHYTYGVFTKKLNMTPGVVTVE